MQISFLCFTNAPGFPNAMKSLRESVTGINDKEAIKQLRIKSYALDRTEELEVLMKAIGGAKIVMLGEASPSILPLRYDAFVFLDKTKALHPLHILPDGHQTPETYPFGV